MKTSSSSTTTTTNAAIITVPGTSLPTSNPTQSNRTNAVKKNKMSTSQNQKRNPKAPHKKESILELTKMIDAKVRVKCIGGRELVGTLRGYDELVNLVLDDADEYLRGKLS
jgi:hypothetical protein